MKGLMTHTSLLGLALVAASLGLPLHTETTSHSQSAVLPARDGHPDSVRLGGVVPPLDLSSYPSRDPNWQSPRARSEPHGHESCASGCAVSHHPTPRLTKDRSRALLAEYQQEPFDQESESLDALLYFGAQICFQLRNDSLRDLLDADHLTYLEHELSRDRAIVSIRLLDQDGKVRAELPATGVPQHVRQVFECDVYDLQPLVCSGTVKRVGKNHIWQRL